MMSNLFSETFTIINQIPQSQTVATKVKWKKHFISKCDRRDGIFDRSSGTMVYKVNAWTVWCKDWQSYKPPLWVDSGYYTLADDEKEDNWTANIGDLIVFAEIPDVEPTTVQEFQTLVTKYKDNGGTITQAQSYIHYKTKQAMIKYSAKKYSTAKYGEVLFINGEPWATNHIEIIKG